MALAKDESTSSGLGRVMDFKRDQGVVLYRSDFDAGFDGWIDHFSHSRPMPPISLTTEQSLRGARSLMLSTGEGAYNASAWENNILAFRRIGLYQAKRFHSYSGYFAVGSGGFTGTWATWELLIDEQKFDNSSRSLYHLRCSSRPSPDFNRWELTNNAGASVTIPSSIGKSLGDNENKQGWNYVRLTIDTQANGGLGGYHEAQVNQSVFDLTSLGAGSAADTIQGATGNAIDEFSGGLNMGLSITRSTQSGGCQLFADDLVYAVSDTWGA